MKVSLRKFASTLLPPILSVGMLMGIVAETRSHLQPHDIEPYHARAKAAIDGVPYVIGTWTGKDQTVTVAAQKLLRPNAILSRVYVDSTATSPYQIRAASMLIVQCRDSRDMVGHYPPICYRAQGMTADDKYCGPRDWTVNGTKIPGYEYQFTEVFQGQTTQTIVYNFLIVPGRGIVRDMKGVERAAEDYQQRYYGAAQFQVVFQGLASAEPSRDQRDEIFATLIGPITPVIQTLTQGGLE
jgi:hypothetical protein